MENQLKAITPQDIVKILKDKFEIEKMSKFFYLEPYQFKGEMITLDMSNSILLRFETLHKDFPDDYKGFPYYKLLLILGFNDRKESSYDVNLQNDLLSIANNDEIDKIVIWSLEKLSPRIIRILKNQKTDILYISEEELNKIKFIQNFFPHHSGNYDYAVILNKTSELLLRRLKKLFHLVLSEIAAPIYNRRYGKAKIATKSIMEYEEKIVWGLSQLLKSQGKDGVAVDVGCGTGRHTFRLVNVFRVTHGFDISPKMIKEAENAKKAQASRNKILFSVSDFEYEELLNEKELNGNTDLIVASFGMASFIENTTLMLKRFHDWLRPGGYVFLSFYNSDSVVLHITPNWRDTSLSAHIDTENKTLRVEMTPDIVFQIYCKPFSDEIKSEIKGLFDIERIHAYPTVMALLPNNLLEKKLAHELFSHIDYELSKGGKYNMLGHYVLIVAKKPGISLTGYANVLETLNSLDCKYKILDHDQVFSIRDVVEMLDLSINVMVKSVVFSYKVQNAKVIVVIAVSADKQVDKAKLATILKINPNILKFATEKQIIGLGFPIGGIAPFGFKQDMAIKKFIDADLCNIDSDWLYMGIGDNTKTLKIDKNCFFEITKDYEKVEL